MIVKKMTFTIAAVRNDDTKEKQFYFLSGKSGRCLDCALDGIVCRESGNCCGPRNCWRPIDELPEEIEKGGAK